MHAKFKGMQRFLISADVMFFAIMWLMVIVIAGTVAQKYIGLYRAQHIYFSSWIIWAGPVPLPGGFITLAVIFSSLTAKLIISSKWNIANAGGIITHIGALLLLGGGLLTSFGSTEGSMTIYEGETSNYITDYHKREVVVYDAATNQKLLNVPMENLETGNKLSIPGSPVAIEVLKICRNCEVLPRTTPATDPIMSELKSRARDFDIKPAPLSNEDELNKSGIQFRISGAGEDQNGVYFSVDFIDAAPQITVGGKTYKIILEKERTYLPFQITLAKFDKQYHPGTDIARSYRSDIVLKDGNTEWKSLVQMNEPLRYKGYTFYQSSFIDEGERQATIFAVVKNAGRMFPYISGIVICIGLLLLMSMKIPQLVRNLASRKNLKKGSATAALLFAMMFSCPTHATIYEFDYDAFRRIPVLDQGRVKPLSSFAETYLKLFYGGSSLPEMSAIEWLAEVLFTPDVAYDRKVFNISDPRVVDAIGLERRSPHNYSYHEVEAGIANNFKAWHGLFTMPEDQLTASQKELMAVYNKLQMFGELSRSLSLVFPDFIIPEGKIADAFGVRGGTALTYLDMLDYQGALDVLGKQAMTRHDKAGGRSSSADDKSTNAKILGLVTQMGDSARDQQNQLFRIIPPQWDEKSSGKPWFSPWGIGFEGQGSPDSLKFIGLWKDLVAEYRSGHTKDWSATAEAISVQSLGMAHDSVTEWKLVLEDEYNAWKPLRISMVMYGLAFVLVLVSLMSWGRRLYWGGVLAIVAGLGLQAIGLVSRMIIMGRPPVTNLYASIIFVGFIVVIVGMAYEWRLRNRIGIIVGAIAGGVLEFISLKYDVEGDTMGMLVAVLDTNFWLSTHVVCMTTGYAACIAGSLMAHIYLIIRMARPSEMVRADELSRNIRGISYLALFFSSLGTILGGIWADQSWGRFWGWDPKENGALLICLWLLFLTHGRVGGRLRELGFNIGMALTSVIVSLAWFGVNLLNVGLHSYGFTQGAATGLVSFIAGEVAFAIVSYVICSKWSKQTS